MGFAAPLSASGAGSCPEAAQAFKKYRTLTGHLRPKNADFPTIPRTRAPNLDLGIPTPGPIDWTRLGNSSACEKRCKVLSVTQLLLVGDENWVELRPEAILNLLQLGGERIDPADHVAVWSQ